MAELTPMMKQYLEIKKDNPDSILFFRLGDFYEMFADDAKLASKELDLTLTSRDHGKNAKPEEERVPMCGIPYHASDAYIARLIAKGYKVAICEQTEDPAAAKGLVKRDIIRVVTPGTVIDESCLSAERSNYLCGVYLDDTGAGLCACDVSTGKAQATVFTGPDRVRALLNELGRFAPAEAVMNEAAYFDETLHRTMQERFSCHMEKLSAARFTPEDAEKKVRTQFGQEALERLRRANIPQVTFTGGEPTLRADLVELVEAAQWFVTRLNTNGRLLTPELCRRLYEASLDSVQVTLYSADAAVLNTLVGAPGFDDTVQGVRNAVAAGLMTSVNTPLCSLNTDYAATLRFAASLGVRYATCSGLIPSGSAEGAESRATRLTEQALTQVLQEAAAVVEELGMELDFTSPGWLPEETLRTLGLHLIPSCGACLSNMALAPDGSIIPCQSWLSSAPLGNMLTDDWASVWNSERCAAIRAESAKMDHICQLQGGNREEGARC